MSHKCYKAINFDLDTRKLKLYYTGSDYHQAYMNLQYFFKAHHFLHRQGSGYVSDIKMNTSDVYELIDKLLLKLPWIKYCVKRIDVTNVGKQHDLVRLLRKSTEAAEPSYITSFTPSSHIFL